MCRSSTPTDPSSPGAVRPRVRWASLLTAFVGLFLGFGAAGASAQELAQKIGMIDVQQILSDSAPGKEVIAELEKLRNSKRAELVEIKTKLDQEQATYQEQSLTLSQEALDEKRKMIEDLAIELRRKQDDAERQWQETQAEEFQKIEAAVMPIIDQVGREGGYTMIFNKFQSGLVFATDNVDLTALVIERYNAAAGSASGQ